VHDLSLSTLEYAGPAVELRTVWMAVRASLRRVLETVTLEDLAAGRLPEHVIALAAEYQTAMADRPPGRS
jgi:DNA-binding IscR family transcriptional regulator